MEGGVGADPEALWVELEGELPGDEHENGDEQEAPAEEAAGEGKGNEHHDVVPVEYAAAGTAAVFHNKGAEGAPDDDANEVADVEEHAEEKELRRGEEEEAKKY